MTENIVNILKTKSGSCCVFPKVIENINETEKKKIPDGLIEIIEEMFPCESAPTNSGTELKKLRQSLGLTQEQLGTILGITHVAVSNYETGRTPVPSGLISMIKKLKK